MVRRTTPRHREDARRRDADLIRRTRIVLGDREATAGRLAVLEGAADSVRRLSTAAKVMLALQAEERRVAVRDVATFDEWKVRGRRVRSGECGLRALPAHVGEQIPANLRLEAVFDIGQTEPRDQSAAASTELAPAEVLASTQAAGVDSVGRPEPTPSPLEHLCAQVEAAGYRIEQTATCNRVDTAAGVVYLRRDDEATAAAALALMLADVLAHPRTSAVTGPNTAHTAAPGHEHPEAAPATPAPVDPSLRPTPTTTEQEDCRTPEIVRLNLGRYGTATAAVTTNWTTGRTRYVVRADRIAGAVTVSPERHPYPDDDTVVPQDIDVDWGDTLEDTDRRVTGYDPHPSPLTANGITLIGGTRGIRPQTILDGERLGLSVRRATGHLTSSTVPTRTEDRVTALTQGVLQHWLSHPDLEAVRLATARYYAPARAAKAQSDADRLQEQIDTLVAERDQHLARAAAFHRLVTESDSDHRGPEPAPPSPAPVEEVPVSGSGDVPVAAPPDNVQAERTEANPVEDELGSDPDAADPKDDTWQQFIAAMADTDTAHGASPDHPVLTAPPETPLSIEHRGVVNPPGVAEGIPASPPDDSPSVTTAQLDAAAKVLTRLVVPSPDRDWDTQLDDHERKACRQWARDVFTAAGFHITPPPLSPTAP
ncbi:hypothetical protein GCM10012275_50490 [Longimycelium tulufanense]|uniref:Uncharacterized protein n=1 Tax=Longimycelium tulufanense TaxID=907463 RepID=A0A8J3CJX3_9PSEU|nr:hypothetical protein [Longimycelium tulufanense]GGM73654.1 hypothetical protein GCM10012275_50490 [Longimycelium tulufanense]